MKDPEYSSVSFEDTFGQSRSPRLSPQTSRGTLTELGLHLRKQGFSKNTASMPPTTATDNTDGDALNVAYYPVPTQLAGSSLSDLPLGGLPGDRAHVPLG